MLPWKKKTPGTGRIMAIPVPGTDLSFDPVNLCEIDTGNSEDQCPGDGHPLLLPAG